MNRWKIILAGFLLALMGGISYAWGVFVIPMMERFGWTKMQTTLPFTVFMLAFAFTMALGGRLQDNFGPKKVAAYGALLFFISYASAALIGHFEQPIWLILTYGMLGGTACGLTYSCVAPPARKWFPDKPALAISLSVMGFGLAAIVVAPLKAKILIPQFGIENTFLMIAILTSAVSFGAAMMLKNPPDDWCPEGWNPTHAKKTIRILSELTPSEIVKLPLFWLIWCMFLLVVSGGLIMLGLVPSYAQRIVNLSPLQASFTISIFSAVNGFGRPLAGYLADRIGIVSVMLGTFLLQAIVFIFFNYIAISSVSLYISVALIGWAYAVIVALFPTLVAVCFGVRHLGVNYGLVFTAFGFGAVVPTIGAKIFDLTGSFNIIFISVGMLSALGTLVALFLKKKFDLS